MSVALTQVGEKSCVGQWRSFQLFLYSQKMMGDEASARKWYEDFLALWKDADADVPIYQRAKAEYARLEKETPTN
jgi:hypothetical protein